MTVEALLRPGEDIDALRRAFMENVVVDAAGCWFWRGKRDVYGNFRGRPAHCVSWELHVGPIEEGLYILHGCDLATEKHVPERGCVNPAHLRPGTPKENAEDRTRAQARTVQVRSPRRDVVQEVLCCKHLRKSPTRMKATRMVADEFRVELMFDGETCLDCGAELVPKIDARLLEEDVAFTFAAHFVKNGVDEECDYKPALATILLRTLGVPLAEVAPKLRMELADLVACVRPFTRRSILGRELLPLCRMVTELDCETPLPHGCDVTICQDEGEEEEAAE